ncbi:MAG: cobamide remodeling phosphodiesterase CbiR [Promethearchaeota archaeon]
MESRLLIKQVVKMNDFSLKFGIIVDIQGALELALGGNGNLTGVNLNRINPVEVVRSAFERHGIKVIELPADANYFIPGLIEKEENVRGLQQIRDDLGLEYTIHLPFFQVHLCSLNHHVRAASIKTQVEAIKAYEKIGGINNYVLHLTSELEDQVGSFDVKEHYKDLAWGLFLDKGMESLEEIIDSTGIESSKICVENMEGVPFSRVHDILLDELDVSICLDVGHAILQGEEKPKDFIKRWGSRVHEIHLHNVQKMLLANRVRIFSDHHGIEKGEIDMKSFLDFLRDFEFKHPILLEILTQKEISDSLSYLKANGFMASK